MVTMISVAVLLLITTVRSLKPPSNLPSLSIKKEMIDRVESHLIPLLQKSMVESRVHLLGKGESLNLLECLKEEMLSGVLTAEDYSWISTIDAAFVTEGVKWQDLPRRIADSLFYYKLSLALEANTVIGNTATFDCFLDKKLANLRRSQPFLEEIAGRIPDIVMADNPLEALETFLYVSLWSMQKDRKLICEDPNITGTAKKRRAFTDSIRNQISHLVKNDCENVLKVFQEGKTSRGDVSIILGNTGKELVADLALAYTLITLNLCETVTFHTQKYTVNEFGATSVDVYGHIEHLADPVHSSVWAVRHFGEALRTHVYAGRLKIVDDKFWCLPTPMWNMPGHIESYLVKSRLVIVKGDNNYRRLLGDRDWSFETDISMALNYWPVSLCALRVIESDIGCGFDERTAAQAGFNKAFMSSGKWGLIQFNKPGDDM